MIASPISIANLCLDVRDGVNADRTVLQQWSCDLHAPSMRWQFSTLVPDSFFKLISAIGSRCLDVAGGSLEPGAQIPSFRCTQDNTNTAQIWKRGQSRIDGSPIAGGDPASKARLVALTPERLKRARVLPRRLCAGRPPDPAPLLARGIRSASSGPAPVASSSGTASRMNSLSAALVELPAGGEWQVVVVRDEDVGRIDRRDALDREEREGEAAGEVAPGRGLEPGPALGVADRHQVDMPEPRGRVPPRPAR